MSIILLHDYFSSQVLGAKILITLFACTHYQNMLFKIGLSTTLSHDEIYSVWTLYLAMYLSHSQGLDITFD